MIPLNQVLKLVKENIVALPTPLLRIIAMRFI